MKILMLCYRFLWIELNARRANFEAGDKKITVQVFEFAKFEFISKILSVPQTFFFL